jgi:hypothetical protein
MHSIVCTMRMVMFSMSSMSTYEPYAIAKICNEMNGMYISGNEKVSILYHIVLCSCG